MGNVAYGTTLKIGVDPSVLVEVTDIDFDGPTVDMIDISHLSSADAHKEFVAGLIDGGKVSFVVNYLATHVALITKLQARVVQTACVITFPATIGTITFNAFVISFKGSAKHSDKLTASLELKVTGKPVAA